MLSNKVSQSNTGIGQPVNSTVSPSTTINSSDSVNSTAGLVKGQIVRGEIVDLRSDEVSVKLEDGRLLTGKLEESSNLAIGEKVSFRVEDVSLKNLTLKIIAEGQYVVQDYTVDKALEAAGLGKNLRNRNIVKELLNQQMSIDKKTISLLIQQSITHKDSPISTLVLMNKYHIPVTEVNIAQFEAYRNSEHSMMSEIVDLADSIPNLFTQMNNSPFPEYITQSNEVLSLILKDEVDSSNKSNTSTLSQLAAGIQDDKNSITIGSLLSQEDRLALAQILSTELSSNPLITTDLYNRIIDGSPNIREVAPLLNQILENVLPFPNSSLTDNIDNTPSQPPIATMIKNSPSAQIILSAYQNLQYNNDISSYLQTSDRAALLKNLDSFPLSTEIKDQIASGDISSQNLLRLIQDNFGSVSEQEIKNLYSSKEFNSLIKETILNKWTFTPKSLTKEDEIDRHFQNLSNQLGELKDYLEKSSGSTNGALAGQVNHLQENINFMKTLNELFTYIQLPLKLHNQNAHGELFVYTKKKGGRSEKDGISVLLHLDMEHLGPTDVYIELHNKNIASKFYFNQEDTMNLISNHIAVLEQTLTQKGYSLNVEVLKRSKEIDIVEDFMKQDTSTTPVTRYNFDIRA